MLATFVGEHKISCVDRIELVDLVYAREDRHIPFEQIDEYPLARFEHRSKRCILLEGIGRQNSGLHIGHPFD